MTINDHFKLNNNPFDLKNDASSVPFDTDKEDICLQILHDLLGGYSPIVLTGTSGSGKTALLRRLSTLLPPDVIAITPFNSCMSYSERVQMTIASQETQQHHAKKLVLIADNAQAIADADLQLLLTLPPRYNDGEKEFLMIWCGTPALEEKLNAINPTKFNNLYPNHYRLVGLTQPQVKNHIDECINRASYSANMQRDIFTSAAINEISRLSKGLPRQINQLCSAALALAFLDAQPQVDAEYIQEAASFCILQPTTSSDENTQNSVLDPEDIIRISPNKRTVNYAKRLLRFYGLKTSLSIPSIFKNETPEIPLVYPKNTKLYAGGLLASGIFLLVLLNFLNREKETTSPELMSDADAFIESLPPTSAGNNASPLLKENAPIELPEKALKTASAIDPASSHPQKKAMLTHKKSTLLAPPQADANKLNTLASLTDTDTLTVKPDETSDTTESQTTLPATTHSAVSTHKPSYQATEKKKKTITKHASKPKTSQRKQGTGDAKQQFVLKPLDAPGPWDEIVMVNPTNNTQVVVLEQAPTNSSDEKKAQEPDHKSKKNKPKFILRPLSAPGPWDEIVLLERPKPTQKNASAKKASTPIKKENLRHLDRENFQFIEKPSDTKKTLNTVSH